MEPERKSIQILLGALILITLSTLVWLSFRLASNAPANAVSYDLILDSALGLYPDNPVTIAGVPVGVVQSVAVEGMMARVKIALRPETLLHRNAKAAVRARSLLGEKYIDLDPGDANHTKPRAWSDARRQRKISRNIASFVPVPLW